MKGTMITCEDVNYLLDLHSLLELVLFLVEIDQQL